MILSQNGGDRDLCNRDAVMVRNIVFLLVTVREGYNGKYARHCFKSEHDNTSDQTNCRIAGSAAVHTFRD